MKVMKGHLFFTSYARVSAGARSEQRQQLPLQIRPRGLPLLKASAGKAFPTSDRVQKSLNRKQEIPGPLHVPSRLLVLVRRPAPCGTLALPISPFMCPALAPVRDRFRP
jgi:hypothetical protein